MRQKVSDMLDSMNKNLTAPISIVYSLDPDSTTHRGGSNSPMGDGEESFANDTR
jgi:hypothetical protein